MNAITKPQYDVLKNDRSFAAISFDEEGRRVCSYCGIDLVTAMREMMKVQWRRRVLIVRNLDEGDAMLPRIEDFEKYRMRAQHLDVPHR